MTNDQLRARVDLFKMILESGSGDVKWVVRESADLVCELADKLAELRNEVLGGR